MQGVKSTSIVYKDLEPIRTEPFACFCAEDQNDCHLELYPRPNGEVGPSTDSSALFLATVITMNGFELIVLLLVCLVCVMGVSLTSSLCNRFSIRLRFISVAVGAVTT